MSKELTPKQILFATYLFEGLTQREAWIKAGYSDKYRVQWIDSHACKLASLAKIKTRIKDLRDKSDSDRVMPVTERKEKLSEIARSKLTDFMELGQDGSWVNIGKETPHGAAIQEIHSRTEYDNDGAKPTVYTSVKLYDPVRAIDLLNKMDKIYSDAPQGSVTNNTQINIYVKDGETRDLLSQIGERTTKLIDDGHKDNKGI